MKNKLFKTFIYSFLVMFIGGLGYFTVDAKVENNKIQEKINEFKKGARFYYYSDLYSTYFYKVSRTNTPSFSIVDDTIYPGNNGDILATLYNEMNIKIISDSFSYFFGGHVAMVCEGNKLFQTTGKDIEGQNKSDYVVNNWLYDNTLRSNFIGIRVNVNQETRNLVVEKSKDYINIPYNYTFVFNRKRSYYCTDLIQRLYEEYSNVKMNTDGLVVTVQDILLSDDVYIFMYKEVDENGHYNIYYLDDGIDYIDFLTK